ncbi:hypothetical protein, partial [Natrialba sp. SSL1]|uniref:hypothetical protein n=1 Tax=Natrialba sp. SSL1 TaxID=1869245 RepID=UPI001C0DFEAF
GTHFPHKAPTAIGILVTCCHSTRQTFYPMLLKSLVGNIFYFESRTILYREFDVFNGVWKRDNQKISFQIFVEDVILLPVNLVIKPSDSRY